MPILSPEIVTLIILTLAILVVVLLVLTITLWSKITKLTRGNNGSLEKVLSILNKDVDQLLEHKKTTDQHFKLHNNRLLNNVAHVHAETFKAFDGLESGGLNSFVIALLSEEGDGILLSSLQARDRLNLFAKPVSKWESERILTDEEKDVLTKLRQ